MEFIEGSITAPIGIYASGVEAGIKKGNRKDLALIRADGSGQVAAVYTQNQVKGHSLLRSQRLTNSGEKLAALVINSGNANACVGPIGDQNAEDMAQYVANALGLQPENVYTASTGVIGQALPMDVIRQGIFDSASQLSNETQAGHDACDAIMTTDKVRKEAVMQFTLQGADIHLAGMAKGSGMIHPNMATMIAVLTTDCLVEQDFLEFALKKTTNKTFNRVSVDGDTSVCDSAFLLATGLAGNQAIGFTPDGDLSEDASLFLQALEAVCMRLARGIAADGEGATKLIDVRVDGAANEETAYRVALTVAKSPLFKTAMFGEDANWGRVITAVGNCEVPIDMDRIDIFFGQLAVCEKGVALPFDEEEALSILKRDEVIVSIDLNSGPYSDHYWTCDFSYEYVEINGSYRS